MRTLWQGVRQPLITLVVAALVITGVMQALARGERRWRLTSNGIALMADVDSSWFFRDSVFVVERAERTEPAIARAYPLRIAGVASGRGVGLPAREMRAAFAEAVAERRGMRLVARAMKDVAAAQAPSVTIAYDFWEGGGVRADVYVNCAARRPDVEWLEPEPILVATEWHDARHLQELREGVGRDLESAVAARCAEDRPRMVLRPDGGRATVDPMQTPLIPGRAIHAVPLATELATEPGTGAGARPAGEAGGTTNAAASTNARAAAAPAVAEAPDAALLAAAARRDSLIAESMARARAASAEVVEIRANPDTITLSVGDRVPLEQALRLTAVRKDGSIVQEFAPLLEVEELSIARLSSGAFVGLRPGTTRVTIRPFVAVPRHLQVEGARTSVVLRVQP